MIDPFHVHTDDLTPHRTVVLATMAVEVARRALVEAVEDAYEAIVLLEIAASNAHEARDSVNAWSEALESATVDLARARADVDPRDLGEW